jgi:hypothetical protein
LHARADAENGELMLRNLFDQKAIKGLSTLIQQFHRRMEHISITPGVEVSASDHDDAVQHGDNLLQMGIKVLIIRIRGDYNR